VIQDWLARVLQKPELTYIPLNFEERTDRLPQLLHDVIARLRIDGRTRAPISKAAAIDGDLRRKQGYTVAMAVKESCLLLVTTFSILHEDVSVWTLNMLLPNVARLRVKWMVS